MKTRVFRLVLQVSVTDTEKTGLSDMEIEDIIGERGDWLADSLNHRLSFGRRKIAKGSSRTPKCHPAKVKAIVTKAELDHSYDLPARKED